MDLTGKTIVVTGAASGIGAATASTLKSMGASVIGLDRNEPSQPVDQYIAIDLMDSASIDSAAQKVPASIDALCNIAGLPPTAGVVPVMTVNMLGLQAITRALIPKINDGGSIVNVASLAGVGWPQAIDQINQFQAQATFDNVESVCADIGIDDARCYFFSKEVLIGWTMQNRWTWRDRHIRMNSVSPGPVETPILKDFLATLGERAEEDARLMDRAGLPADIAPVVAFLCSDESAWIRGANIPCDGGMFAHVQCEMTGL